MSNVIKEIAKISDGSTTSYQIGANANNIFYSPAQGTTYSLNEYLPRLVITDTLDNYVTADTLNNYVKNDDFNNSTGTLDTNINTNLNYIMKLSSSASTTSNWGSSIVLDTINATSGASSASIAANNTLKDFTGKFNYLRSHPFIIIRYRQKSASLKKNCVTLVTFGKKAVEEILIPNGNVLKSVSTSSINLDNYLLQAAFGTQVSIGGAEPKTTVGDTSSAITYGSSNTAIVIPQRAFIEQTSSKQYVCAGVYSNTAITTNINVRVIATLKG